MREILLRLVLGGTVVSAFAILGDVLKPKSFAGLFGAAPSVALATLGLACVQHGAGYASLESRSMILGAIAFVIYAAVVTRLLIRKKWPVLPVTSLALILWIGMAFGMLYGFRELLS